MRTSLLPLTYAHRAPRVSVCNRQTVTRCARLNRTGLPRTYAGRRLIKLRYRHKVIQVLVCKVIDARGGVGGCSFKTFAVMNEHAAATEFSEWAKHCARSNYFTRVEKVPSQVAYYHYWLLIKKNNSLPLIVLKNIPLSLLRSNDACYDFRYFSHQVLKISLYDSLTNTHIEICYMCKVTIKITIIFVIVTQKV